MTLTHRQNARTNRMISSVFPALSRFNLDGLSETDCTFHDNWQHCGL
jgi:hypothetical protein